MTFRFATPEDAPAILEVYAPYIRNTVITFEYEVPSVEAFTERVKGITEKYPYLVCEENGVLLGYAYAGEYRSRTAFQWDVELSIYLRPEAQGKGVSKAFYDRLLPMVEKLGYRNIYSSIVTPNPASIGLQEKYGFETLCVFEKCGYKLGQWCDLLWMHKKIGDWSKDPVPPTSISEVREELKKLL